MSDINQAVNVTTDVDIDWAELGRVLGEERSDLQAEFFIGFMETVADMQLAFIGSERVLNGVRADVSEVLHALAAHVEQEGEAS